MKNILVKVLMAAVLLLLALTVYNNKVIESKENQIVAIKEKQEDAQRRLNSLSTQLEGIVTQVELANISYRNLSTKIDAIEKKKQNYSEEVRKIKNENEETKQLLDTKLPAEFKRVLNDALRE